MNKKILALALAKLSYGPTPNLPSTYLQMTPVVMNLKRYINNTDDLVSFERATHNISTHTIPRQEVVFDFIDAFRFMIELHTTVQSIL